MSKTKAKTSTAANPKTQVLARRHTGRSSQSATGGERHRSIRETAPAAPANPAAPARAKGRAAPGAAAQTVAVPRSRPPSKVASAEVLLRRPGGATVADLMTATGWQQHSVRAVLSGLRKQGAKLEKAKDPASGTIYRIIADASAAAG